MIELINGAALTAEGKMQDKDSKLLWGAYTESSSPDPEIIQAYVNALYNTLYDNNIPVNVTDKKMEDLPEDVINIVAEPGKINVYMGIDPEYINRAHPDRTTDDRVFQIAVITFRVGLDEIQSSWLIANFITQSPRGTFTSKVGEGINVEAELTKAMYQQFMPILIGTIEELSKK
jgi:hypothetical protein